jgi:hypothetical protein
MEHFASKVGVFDFANDLAARNRNLDHSPDSNRPSMDYSEGRTMDSTEVVVSWVVESLKGGLRDDSGLEGFGH